MPPLTSPGARRWARTGLQLLAAVITAAPVLLTVLADTPAAPAVAAFAGWVAIVARLWTGLEDAGVIPAVWRDDVPAPRDRSGDAGHAHPLVPVALAVGGMLAALGLAVAGMVASAGRDGAAPAPTPAPTVTVDPDNKSWVRAIR